MIRTLWRPSFALLAAALVALGVGLASSPAGAAPEAPEGLAPDGDEDGKDEGKDEEGKDGAGEEEATVDETVKAALAEMLNTPHSLRPGNVLSVTYNCAEQGQLEDFEAKGFDKCEVNPIDNFTHSETALEIGAGSRGMGFMQHRVTLNGDFEISVTMWVNVNAPSSVVAFTLGKKVAVLWGQTICKSNLKPMSKRSPDVTKFGENRKCTIIMTRKGAELSVKINGQLTDKYEFRKGELDGIKFGVMARNVRFVLNEIRIEGVVDTSKL